ncbi:Bug family tripartite tricarboxylate transporter substrate binding protein [Pseudaquabacterium inlustre]
MKTPSMLKALAAAMLPLMLMSAPAPAAAQASAGKSLRWIVPYPAGGGSDFLARTIGQTLGQQTGTSVVVDNKPGANTAIGAVETIRSAADGHTVMSADNGTMVFNPALYKNLTYQVKDLAPVTLMGRFPMILVVNPQAGYADAKAFVAAAKARPGQISFASAGAGSPHHLAMELLKSEAGLFMVHVPYRGAAPALQEVAGGQLPAMMTDLAAGNALIKAGKLKPLAVAHATRLPQLPDVPTFAELGFKGVEAAALVGMVAPAATPADTIAGLAKSVAAAIKDPAVTKRLTEFGVEPVGSTPAQYADLLKSETARWHKLIADKKITLE